MGIVAFLTGNRNFPTGNRAFLTGKTIFPVGKNIFPVRKIPSQREFLSEWGGPFHPGRFGEAGPRWLRRRRLGGGQ